MFLRSTCFDIKRTALTHFGRCYCFGYFSYRLKYANLTLKSHQILVYRWEKDVLLLDCRGLERLKKVMVLILFKTLIQFDFNFL